MKKIVLACMAVGAMSFLAADAALYKKCSGCHGVNGEKKALGKGKVITGMAAADVVTALNGYKDGSYGGAMKGIMKGPLAGLSDDDIKALGTYIEGLK